MSTDWSKLKVVDLKAELKRRGLPQAGRKDELVNRLAEADAEKGAEEGAEEPATAIDDAGHGAEPAQPLVPDEHTADDVPAQSAGLTVEKVAVPQEKIEEASNATIAASPVPAPASPPTSDGTTLRDSTTAQEPADDRIIQDDAPPQLPKVPSAEVVQDAQKRKRRSGSPPPSNEDTPRKRMRTDDQSTASDIDMTTQGPEASKQPNGNTADSNMEDAPPQPHKQDTFMDQEEPLDYGADSPVADFTPASAPKPQLMAKETTASDMPLPQDPKAPKEEHLPTVNERTIEPAIHPATSALYIKGFMRPLRAPMVEEYLIDLATPPGGSPDPSVISNFYLDQIRTHAFVQFNSVSSASRVRSALHDRVWPDERERKPLWVDFVPSDEIEEWIRKEQSGGNSRNSLNKWEVVYDLDGDTVVATLQEPGVHTKPARPPPPTAAAKPVIPTGPSRQFPGIESAPSGPKGFAYSSRLQQNLPGNLAPTFPVRDTRDARDNDGANVKTTRAGPRLFYQPVPEELARRRMSNIHRFVSKDPSRNLGREKNRYTFEATDMFVDRGREIFDGIRPPHREAARRRNPGRPGPPPSRQPRNDRFGGRGPRRDDYRPPGRFNGFRSDRPPRDNYRDRR